MLLQVFALGLACICSASTVASRPPPTYESHDFYALHIHPSTSPSQVAASVGLQYEGLLGELEDHHIFTSPKRDYDVVKHAIQDLRRRRLGGRDVDRHSLDSLLLSQKQTPRLRLHKRIPPPPTGHFSRDDISVTPVETAVEKLRAVARDLEISDPIFADQWHLFNTIQVGNDVNVTDLWRAGITGKNATVAIVDDGLDMYSDDLKDNYFAEGSFDFNDKGPEPRPRLDNDNHGTRCAGEIAAVRNNVCGVGVAYDAKVAGIRILSKQISDADEAVAMNYAYDKNQIYSCSWGPPDDGEAMEAPGILIKKAFVNAVQKGRQGKGSVFVFASGNGASSDDNCNFDGYTNSIYSITVGAVDREGNHPYYSEKCSAQLVVTYSSGGGGEGIHTTDVGTNKCYTHHGGTSAAAPLAAGIFALVLSIRPDLSWRDMQYLSVQAAAPFNLEDSEWHDTTIGKKYSHKFGYGRLDSWALVEAAKTFQSVKPQAWYKSPWMHVKQDIPQGDQGLATHFEITKETLLRANFARVEHVTVTMNVKHERRGDLSVELKSPNGIISHLSARRPRDKATTGYEDWTFMSVVHWGESGVGDWMIIVKDTEVNEYTGNLTDWKITLWGECIDPKVQELHPLPSEHDDDDHDVISAPPVATTSISVPTKVAPTITALPTDHPDRPINEKPSETPPSTGGQKPGFLPSIFPTFGVGPKTQVWIYASFGLILVFCCGLAIYLYTGRLQRLRNNLREDYEFQVVDGEETEALAGGRRRRRAGELYDAFASGESDDDLFSESDVGDEEDDGGEEEQEAYRDNQEVTREK
ncbi:MAG: pheromone processing endoprotease [Vezdaea aestivalis]|nr:MAG: pheromone processing endoprotease [Vezdaea aestivalis]